MKAAAVNRPAVKNRIGAAFVTIAAHVAIIVALVVGFHTARQAREPSVIMVRVSPEENKPVIQPPRPPVFIKPSVLTAPMPEVTIAAPPSAMSAVTTVTPTPVAPPPPPASSSAVPTWQGSLLARLQQAKRYPEEARTHRQQGVVMLLFTMDRSGRVLSAKIQKSSGYDALDQETLALIQRAQPLPKPPAEIKGDTIQLAVPVEFFIKSRR